MTVLENRFYDVESRLFIEKRGKESEQLTDHFQEKWWVGSLPIERFVRFHRESPLVAKNRLIKQ